MLNSTQAESDCLAARLALHTHTTSAVEECNYYLARYCLMRSCYCLDVAYAALRMPTSIKVGTTAIVLDTHYIVIIATIAPRCAD